MKKQPKKITEAALALVSAVRNVAFHGDATLFSLHELVRSFVLVTRIGNMVSRRQAELRKLLDARQDFALKPGDDMVQFEADGFLVTKTDANAGRKGVDEQKALLLLVKKGISKRLVMERPKPPEPHFSEELFKELVDSGDITEKEFKSCQKALAQSPKVTVSLPEEIDQAIALTVLGSAKALTGK